MKNTPYIAYIEQDENGVFIGSIPSVPSCHAQGHTEEEMLENLREALALCIRNTEEDVASHSRFVGIKELTIAHA
ncbi:MAG: type II toxin-antitoxin system HicB family antitoxin [Parcubacteria group bacterium]|nr:type II toxin-antitoxin system HicB family antitoxin [Parcubacteria group bacterium]